MRLQNRRERRSHRGAAAMLFGLLLPVFIGIGALALDTGVLAVARGQLSTAADAAALAGAQQLADDYRTQGITDLSTEIANANAQAQSFGQANKVLGQANIVNKDPNNDGSGDILVGYLDPSDSKSTLDTSAASSSKFNSVQVRLQRSADHVAPVPSFFGQYFGVQGTTVAIQSTATAWPYTVKAVKGNGSNAMVFPIVLDVNTYNKMIAGQTQDAYTYNPSTGTVTEGADGVTESILYPVGSGSPGNWGTIKVGVTNNSTSTLSSQIHYGITPSQLGTYPNSTIQLDQTLSPPSITFSGNPGISAGIKSAIDAIIGQVRLIPIYDLNGGNGSNAWYRVIEFAPLRIMASNFQGNPKYVVVQPALFKQDGTVVPGSPAASWNSPGVIVLHLSR
jgi:Flp pilus assembly protein TadG